jgi:hypothetical protein
MLRNAFHALAYWTPALIICLAVGARAAAPFPYHETDYAQPVTESLIAVAKQRSDKDTLYIKVDGGDASAAILTELNNRKLPPTFAPWSARSPKEEHCRALGAVINGGCLRDNFLEANFLSMPLWHVALVHVKAGVCTAELTLVLGASQWHVVSQRAVCT